MGALKKNLNAIRGSEVKEEKSKQGDRR